MSLSTKRRPVRLTGHALRDAHLRAKSLRRAQTAPPLARALVTIRVKELGLTRLEFARRSGLSRGTLRDIELGIHAPTRRLLQRLLAFYRRCRVKPELLEEVRQLYTGPPGTIRELIGWLEVQAGSSRELARRVGISPSTLWEYRRGRFPLTLDLLKRLCAAVDEDVDDLEQLWLAAERQRLLARGYPEPLAEFWALCHRSGLAEKDLPGRGMSTAALRQLRYLELPVWDQVAKAARRLCRDEREFDHLRRLWTTGEREPGLRPHDDFGPLIQKLRVERGISRREIADLFGVGGKKPAQSVKQIEEEGAYSSHAFPAGLAAVLSDDPEERIALRRHWEARRSRFLQRHRPETWVELRLRREAFGFDIAHMEAILGYAPLEYQRIERGVVRLTAAAMERVLAAVEKAGEARVEQLLGRRRAELTRRASWSAPPALAVMVELLVERAGGLVPFARQLRCAGVLGLWPGRVKAIAAGADVPPWPIVERLAKASGVVDLSAVRADWQKCYRRQLEVAGLAPLAVEVRLLIGEVATSTRALSPQIRISYPVLTRDLQRLDSGRSVRWSAVERILIAARVDPDSAAWQRVEAWWLGSGVTRK